MIKKFLLLIFLLIVLISGGIFWLYQNTKSVSATKTFQNFLITKGQSGASVATKLQSAGLIKNALAFRIYVRLTGQSGKIQAGEFRLSPSYSLFQTVDQLLSGPIEIWVTIPEGLRREEIAGRFATTLERDQTFINAFLASSKGQEGYLFPDTYLFAKDASASAIVKKMANTFDAKVANIVPNGTALTPKDLIILASILERETKTNTERPIVAGILINRLEAGMPLQVDASVQYAVGTSKNWWPILTRADLGINSKYNTYKFAGLPPSPIASPGISSIMASYNPTANDYWYYIHDDSGQIHYAKTLDEHNANIRKYLGK
ncbi:MAG TPA: endolytic transglycosylase MltG [Patescibacteria group bacterium]|nr:endolytic transglycosylase MltG [Patescibacteria group bacterium]